MLHKGQTIWSHMCFLFMFCASLPADLSPKISFPLSFPNSHSLFKIPLRHRLLETFPGGLATSGAPWFAGFFSHHTEQAGGSD